jgi:5'-nucleotidase (lipoprotein e(P4) family)
MSGMKIGLALLFAVSGTGAALAETSSALTDAGFLQLLDEGGKTIAAQAQAAKADAAAEAPGHVELQYVHRSAEYPAVQAEVYLRAAEQVLPKLKKEKSDWAIVLDVDDTVLNHYEFERRMAAAGKSFDPAAWDAWVKERAAPAIPGAKDFLDGVRAYARAHAKHRGRVVYITDRGVAQEKETVDNLVAQGLFVPGTDLLLNKKDKNDTKDVRRACVEKGDTGTDERCAAFAPATIVALFGDSLRDFFELYGKDASEQGPALLGECEKAGRCYVLPNPMYGQWGASNPDGSYYGAKPTVPTPPTR